MFQENFKNKFQGCFKNVSMKFFFVILFLLVSHRSYPSRRRACSFSVLEVSSSPKVFQMCFKNVSTKFCFAVFLDIIAVTRAEGGLVLIEPTSSEGF